MPQLQQSGSKHVVQMSPMEILAADTTMAAEHNIMREGTRTQLLTSKLGGHVRTQKRLPKPVSLFP